MAKTPENSPSETPQFSNSVISNLLQNYRQKELRQEAALESTRAQIVMFTDIQKNNVS